MNDPYLCYACRCARPCPCQDRPHSHRAATAIRAKVALALADFVLAATEARPVARQLAMADGAGAARSRTG